MDKNEALQQLELLQKKLYAYTAAESALFLDGETTAPADTAQGRGVALGILAGERQKLFASPRVGELLEYLESRQEELEPLIRRQVEVLRRSYNQLSLIPGEEFTEYIMLTNEAGDLWRRAKRKSDFSMFAPVLEKLVAYNQNFAEYYARAEGVGEKIPADVRYNALLNEFERGTDMEYLDQFFDTIRERLVPLIREIGQVKQVDDSFLHRHYPADVQRRFSDYLMEVLGLDRNHCAIAESEHPFTLEFNNKDVRITTHYKEDNVADSMYSVIHEGGHAIYELGIRDELQYTCLAGGASMGVHESQSRFYENIIGRSRPFIEAVFPKMQEFFPEQLRDVTAEQMYRAVNKVEPSLIRTESDELTYSLHVLIRYEIEKQLIAGTLEVKEVPQLWNQLYREYLGVEVPDDAHGCLQDSHWAGGSFGYFPSYALGSAYGAQMLKNMEQDMDVWEPVRKGDLSVIRDWLGEKIHRYGQEMDPAEIIKNACGSFDPTVYTEYLTRKYRGIYGI